MEINGDCDVGWEAVDELAPEDKFCDSTRFRKARNIKVTSDPVLVEAYEMGCDQRICIDRYLICDEPDMFIPYTCNGCRVVLAQGVEKVLLFLPGNYKLFLCGDDCDYDNDIYLSITPLSEQQANLYAQFMCCCDKQSTVEVKTCG